MANVVEIVIQGADQATPAMESASKGTKKLGNDMKALGGTVGQVGNIFKAFGNTQLANVVSSIEAGVSATRQMAAELSKSRIAIVGLGTAAAFTGFQIGDMIRQWIPFFNSDIKVDKARAAVEEIGKILNQRLALRSPDRAQLDSFLTDIDKQVADLVAKKPNFLGSITGGIFGGAGRTKEEEEKLFQLQMLRIETIAKARKDAEEKRVREVMEANEKIAAANQQAFEAAKRGMEELNKSNDESVERQIEKAKELQEKIMEDARETSRSIQEEMQEREDARLLEMDGFKRLIQEKKELYENSLLSMRSATYSFVASVAGRISDGLGTAIANIITGAQSAKEAFQELGKAMLQMLIKWAAQLVINAALSLVLGAVVAKATSAFIAPILGQWTAAATAASIATFGGATAFGAAVPIMQATNVAFAQTLGGIAHGGLDYVPRESTFLLDEGERVMSRRENQEFTAFMRSGGGGGGYNIDGRKLGDVLYQMSRDGRLRIDGRAIV